MKGNFTVPELPPVVRDLLSAVPRHGEGLHPWLFRTARQLHHHRSPDHIADLLAAATEGCGRDVPRVEIENAIRNSANCAWRPSGNTHRAAPPKPKWPDRDNRLRESLLSGSFGLADLFDRSPIDPTSLDAERAIDLLFEGNPLLCVGESNAVFTTASLEDLKGKLGAMALIVPSPMTALAGKRKSDGKESAHTLANTGPRRYLVIEFDSGTPDEQAVLIHHLSGYAPLACAVWSGSKSLHGWFDCHGAQQEVITKFFRYAVRLGADPATWTRSQFVRIPGGWRPDKGVRQDIQYFSKEGEQ